AGIDGVADRGASQAQRVPDAAGDGGFGIGRVVQQIMVVEFEDERDFAGELGRAGLQETERRRVGVASGVAGEREMIARIVGRRIWSEAPRRTVLEALVYGQDDEGYGAGESSVIDHSGKVAKYARVFRALETQNFPGTLGHNSLRFTIRYF